MPSPNQRKLNRTFADTRWLRLKSFPNSGFAWVLSIGRHEGRRLNVSWHRKEANR